MKFALKSESEPRIEATVKLARSEPGVSIRASDLDLDPLLFNTRKGTLDLRTGKLREPRRDDLLSKASPIAYDPDATCPAWRKFIREVKDGNSELAEYLQRCAGYSLRGEPCEDG